ncbi:sensor histidine kinase [Pseudoflavitalea rhizosphaerae]|uniref:sensor histidine kinase n=1 Tax=Pseudoflavitalea rhizosphaerae TaxID=1884793 RepID=UPI000F8CBBC6|nr:ATP-binding protein [Pseudoflavitalea rhizosphaerae]
MDAKLFTALSKFPYIANGEFFDSVELKQNKTCLTKCKQRDCIAALSTAMNGAEYICQQGYNNTLMRFKEFSVIINGMIFQDNASIPKGRLAVREKWIVAKEDVTLFQRKMTEIEGYIDQKEAESIEKNFSMFHDFKTSMNIFFNCTQDIIRSLPGTTFENKLDTSDAAYQTLYHALGLITSQLGMIDVIINPRSILLGNKTNEINIYKLFDKVQKLFYHIVLKKRNVSIKLSNIGGAYIKNSLCYDSIEFVPLVLIDNAIKYSAPDSTIDVEIRQFYYGKLKVSVKSIGPFVKDENKDKIFDKFFRDEGAVEFAKSGIGMGLWIAQQVLAAHNSKLYYFKDNNAAGKIGLNIFEFELSTI